MARRRQQSKYGAHKVEVDGIMFDSKKEAVRYSVLKAMEKEGIIWDLQRQVKFVLIPAQRAESTEAYQRGANKGQPKPGKLLERECSYVADFTYRYRGGGEYVVEDVKGYRDPSSAAYAKYTIKRKLMLYVYGIWIHEV